MCRNAGTSFAGFSFRGVNAGAGGRNVFKGNCCFAGSDGCTRCCGHGSNGLTGSNDKGIVSMCLGVRGPFV